MMLGGSRLGDPRSIKGDCANSGPRSWSRIKAREERRSSAGGDAEGYATTSTSVHLKLKRLLETSLIDGSQQLAASCLNKG